MACVQVHKTMFSVLKLWSRSRRARLRRKRCINQITKKDFEHRLKTKSKNRGRAHEGRDEEKEVCKPDHQKDFEHRLKTKSKNRGRAHEGREERKEMRLGTT
jgi:hypothetical protein